MRRKTLPQNMPLIRCPTPLSVPRVSINLTSIVTILDYEITVRKCLTEMLFPPQKENKRKVIVDLALKSGINQYRFVVFDVNSDGRILWNSNQYIRPDSEVVKLADNFLREKEK